MKDFDRFMCNKTKNENKKYFCGYCLQCFSSENVLQKHKKVCLKINGKQSIKLRSGSIKFKNYSKQLAAPFKIYADFESVLKEVQRNDSNNACYTKKYKKHIPCRFAYKVVCIDNRLTRQLFFTEEKCSQ